MNKNNPRHKLRKVNHGLILLLLFVSPMLIKSLTEGRADQEFETRVSQGRVERESTREFRTEKFPACKTEVMSDEVFVKFNKSVSPDIVQALISQTLFNRRSVQRSGSRLEAVGMSESLYLIHIDGFRVADLLEHFSNLNQRKQEFAVMVQNDIEVKYVKPNFILYRNDSSPQNGPLTNDPQFSDQWALRQSSAVNGGISAVVAWKISKGSPSIVIGVIDTGIKFEHPDLDDNMWTAPWDFIVRVGGQDISCRKDDHGFNAPDKTCIPSDQSYHGTRVSGIIGAEGNNGLGIVGVNWSTSIMGIRHIDKNGKTNEKDIVNSIEFAVAAKRQPGLANIRVLNNSYGYQTTHNEICYPDPLADAVRLTYEADILFVASAGNDKSNNDNEPFYPANLTIPNVISVGGTTSKDKRYSMSNWGLRTVHLGAPAASIVSTNPSGYDTGSGTSYGAPFVAGSAALILSKCPTLTAVHLKSCILNNADEVKSLEKYFPKGRRLNVNSAIQNCGSYVP